MGGIGNNLFQYLAYLAAKERGLEPILVRNLTESNLVTKVLGWTIHENIFARLHSTEKVSSVVFFRSIFKLILSKYGLLKTRVFFNTLPNSINGHTDVFGYFQTKEFVAANKSSFVSIRELLKGNFESDLDGKLVVHFRWGDSGWAKRWNTYYDTLIKLSEEFEDILIITDDQEVAIRRFSSLSNVVVKKPGTALEDFQILMSSDHLFCAPSTFSWWASQLLGETSTVYMPEFLFEKLGHHGKGKLKIVKPE